MTGRPDRPTALLRDSAGFTLWSVDSSVGVSPSDSWRLEATSLLKPGWLDTPDRAVVFFQLGRERLTRIRVSYQRERRCAGSRFWRGLSCSQDTAPPVRGPVEGSDGLQVARSRAP